MSDNRNDQVLENASLGQPGTTPGTPELLTLKKQLLLLHQVGNELSTADSFDALCRQAIVQGRQLLGPRRFGLWFRNADSMVMTGSFGVDEQGEIRDERAQKLTVSRGSPMGHVLAHQHPMLFRENSSVWNDKGQVVGKGMHVTVALWNGNRVTGCICMDNFLDQRPISEADCDLLKLYADTIGYLAFRKKVEDELKQSLKEKEFLLQEIHHRVKNNLQVISSLLNLQAAQVRDPYDLELFRQSQRRIKAMAKVYETFYQAADFTRINVHNYVQSFITDLFHAYQIDPALVNLRLDGRKESLALTQAIPCGLIINELVTNALKHGFRPGQTEGHPRRGEITIALHRKEHQLSLLVGHNGLPLPPEVDWHTPRTLGLQLVNALVVQLNGTLTVARENGTLFTITFPDEDQVAPSGRDDGELCLAAGKPCS